MVPALAAAASFAQAAPASGARIVYDAFSDRGSDVFSVNPSGSGRRQLTHAGPFDFDAAWGPKHRRIVFSRAGRLYVMKANGKRKRRIRNTRFAGEPAWSPNGKWIVYTRSTSGDDDGLIYRIRPNGKRRKRLARGSAPAWSPSGKSIAYTGNGAVRTMRAGGGRKRLLLPNASQPDWSPDGESIAFVRESRVWAAEANGSDPYEVSTGLPDGCEIDPDDCGREDDSPAWSPSGNRIAYSQTFPAGHPQEGVHTIRPNGSGDRRVARGGHAPDW